MRLKIIVHIFGLLSYNYVTANKTITISAPNCNFNMTVKVPTTQCCCPVPTLPPTTTTMATTTVAPGPNTGGCIQSRIYNPPTCVVQNNQTFGGPGCDYFYICKGVIGYCYAVSQMCPMYQTYSVKQQKCVPKPRNQCCVD